VFDAELKANAPQRAGRSRQGFQSDPKGITFVTDTFMPEWMEVGVEMRLPQSGARRDQRGYHVPRRGRTMRATRQGKGFEVVLMFLDLPKRAQAQLSVAPSAVAPSASRSHADFRWNTFTAS
jgi:hypothetical protein